MSSDADNTSSGDIVGGGIRSNPPVQPTPQPGEALCTTESAITTTVASTQVGAKERNLMFLITGCSGLFLSNTAALGTVFWGFYNTTHSLPAIALPEWMIGFIFSTYGSAVVVWLQNKLEKIADKTKK